MISRRAALVAALRRGRILAAFAVAVFATLAADPAQAATCTWNRTTGTNNWNASTLYWSCGVIPGSNDDVIFNSSFDGSCTISSTATAKSVTIQSGYSGTLTKSATFTVQGNFAQAGGTFSGGGSSTITITGNLNLSGGSFTANSGLLDIQGAFNKTGGTFSHGNGRVMLSSTSSQTFASHSATFHDLYINDGLVGYWKLDETSGSTAADSSGYGNSLTHSGSPTISSDVPSVNFTDARSLSMTGTQYAATSSTLPSILQPTVVTIAGWYKATSVDNYGGEIASGSDHYAIRVTNGGVKVIKQTGASSWVELSATVANSLDGNWHHLAGVITASGMTAYFDGAQVASNSNTSAIYYSPGQGFNVGRNPNNGDYDFRGSIDEVRVYRRALSASEINSLAIGNQPGTAVATHTMTGSPTVSGDLTIASGNLNVGTNNLTVGGSWWNYGGLFSTGTSGAKVTFNGTGTTNYIRSAGQVFNEVEITGSGTWTLADRLELAAAWWLDIDAGTLNGGAYSMRVGDINTTGTFNPGTGTVVLNTNANRTLDTPSYNHLRIEDATETSLVGYWKLDEGQGTTTRDYSGNSLAGTLTNDPFWSTSNLPAIGFDNPTALKFDGSDDYVSIGEAAVSSSASFSVCAWVKMTSTSGWRTFVSVDGADVSNFYLQKRDDTGKFALSLYSSDSEVSPQSRADSTTTPSVDTWYHLCGTYDTSNLRLYVNGTLEDTEAFSSGWAATGDTIIGAAKWNGLRVDYFSGYIDDVRIYSTALTQSQVSALAAGRYPNMGGTATYTLSTDVTVGGTLAIDSGTVNPSTYNLTAANTDATKVAYVNAGTLTVGSGIAAFLGGLTVQPFGTLTMATSGGSVRLASGKTLRIDGTLNASSTGATIRNNGSGSYAFLVGSTSTATPTLNITGLAVQNTDTNGMWINSNTSALTTFTRFDNIAFSSGATGGNLLQIYAPSLNLVSNGCTFDASTTHTVKLVGDGFTTDASQTRAVFGSATCSAGSCPSTKSDDDPNNDGVPTASSGGAVAQFVSNAPTDTAGTIVGFPTAAFSWNDGSWYATYVAFNSASGTAGTIYVRDTAGAPRYSWSTPASETIVSTPRWTTEGTGVNEKHYVYVALASGKVYRLLDNGSSLAPDTASPGWSTTNPFDCGCTITTPTAMTTTNLYWGGRRTSDSTYRVWAVGQADQSVPGWSPMRPSAVSSPTTSETAVTSASLAFWTSGSTYLFLGQTGYLVKANVSTGTVAEYNSNPGTGNSVLGRIMVVGSGTNRVLAGDDGGSFWSIAPGTFTGTNRQWGYTTLAGTDQLKSTPIYDHARGYVHFGSEGGRLIVLDASTGSPLSGYPMTSLTTDPMRTAILYRNGVIAVGTTTGKLFFVNRRTTSSGTPVLMKQYFFGSTQQVSGIAFDSTSDSYLVSTSGSSADGRLFMIDATESVLTDTDGNL